MSVILEYAVSADLLAAAILCLTVAICFVLLYNILSNLTHWLQHDNRPRHEAAVFRRIVVHYNAFVRDVDDRRAQRLRDSNLLPPMMRYEGAKGSECVICLEDFEDGESCQVFPVCNHVFHTLCIDHWLKNRPTCPLCRNSILQV